MGCGMRYYLRVIHVCMVWYPHMGPQTLSEVSSWETPFGPKWVLLACQLSRWSQSGLSSGRKHPILDPLQMEVLRWCGGPHERRYTMHTWITRSGDLMSSHSGTHTLRMVSKGSILGPHLDLSTDCKSGLAWSTAG